MKYFPTFCFILFGESVLCEAYVFVEGGSHNVVVDMIVLHSFQNPLMAIFLEGFGCHVIME